MPTIRVVYAADRAIGVRALELLLGCGIEPVALMLPEPAEASHATEIRNALPPVPVIEGRCFVQGRALATLADLAPDYLLSVHFPYLFPPAVLALPRIGTLNLHPALLPFNRGWHTPSWAILEGTPVGATLHWVDDAVDSGDIALQRQEEIRPSDTAHSLYQRLLELELEVLASALPLLKSGELPRQAQAGVGSWHRKADLAGRQEMDLGRNARVGEVIDLLRALTTNNPQEAAYFSVAGQRYSVRVEIAESPST